MKLLVLLLLPLVHSNTVSPTPPIAEPMFDKNEIVKIEFLESRSVDGGLLLAVDSKNRERRHLHLEKADSILSPNFAILEPCEGSECSDKFSDVTHTVDIHQMADQIYTNQEEGAFLHVADGKVHGLLNSHTHIRSLEDEDGSHEIIKGERDEGGIDDYAELPFSLENLQTRTPSSGSPSATVTIYPEIFVFIDELAYNKMGLYGQYNHFYYKYYYLLCFWSGVDHMFKTTQPYGLNVYLRLSGWQVIKSGSCEEDEFITPYLVNGDCGKVDGRSVLYAFGKTLYNYRNSLKYDLAYFMTGRDLMYRERHGYSSALRGIAFVGGACFTYNNMEYRVGIGEDRYGSFSGVHVAAHEVAHLLGSYHDGERSSRSCHWTDGYIMSYLGWGTRNKLHFSNCTAHAIKGFAGYHVAACLKQYSGAYLYYPHYYYIPGRRYNADQQCASYLGYGAKRATDCLGDELCRNLKCKLGSNTYQLNIPALEGTYCNRSKICRHGDCR